MARGGVAGVDGELGCAYCVPGVDEAGVHPDEFTDADWPVEVNVADVGGDAVAATLLGGGGGVGNLVDPFE